MSSVSDSTICLHQATRALELLSEGGWECCVFSQQDPFKLTPNEDSAVVIPSGEDSVVLAVADGCGGMRGGDVASKTAIEYLVRSVEKSFGNPNLIRNAILDGIEEANDAIQSLKLGAACTIAVVELNADMIRSYHVGDSMILMTTNRGRIRYQSISHSPIGYAVESGMLSEDVAMHHADRHLISNCLGSPKMRIEVGPSIPLGKNDRLLIASDGLFDNLSIDEVVAELRCGAISPSIEKLAEIATSRMNGNSPTTDPSVTPSKPDDLTMIGLRRRLPTTA